MAAGGTSAATEASVSAATGAGGTGTSGEEDAECAYFCDLFFQECSDELESSFFANDLYPDRANCMSVCTTYEKGGFYGSDTLGCRQAHLEDNPGGDFHCLHASESGGGQCPTEQ
jgi:hypothetical protein